MTNKISSLDSGYVLGDLSVYPEALDNKETLYEVKNNAITALKQILPYNGKYLIVEDTSSFPSKGILRIGGNPGTDGTSELIYYETKKEGVFTDLIRGFAGTRQNPWPKLSVVSNAVCAEPHNALKDALINIEGNIGPSVLPAETTLNGILGALEEKFLSPKPIFRAFPTIGAPGMRVRFQNFVVGETVRVLWDFGDGSSSIEKNPIHTYRSEGIYTVKLNVLNSTLGQGISVKNNYITVKDEERVPFFYVTPTEGYSIEKAAELTSNGNPTSPTVFKFVDQTDGDITQRYWVFDDGETETQNDPNIHFTSHSYLSSGTYSPTVLNLFSSQQLKRVFISNSITVL